MQNMLPCQNRRSCQTQQHVARTSCCRAASSPDRTNDKHLKASPAQNGVSQNDGSSLTSPQSAIDAFPTIDGVSFESLVDRTNRISALAVIRFEVVPRHGNKKL